jgi:hypothetical protein
LLIYCLLSTHAIPILSLSRRLQCELIVVWAALSFRSTVQTPPSHWMRSLALSLSLSLSLSKARLHQKRLICFLHILSHSLIEIAESIN